MAGRRTGRGGDAPGGRPPGKTAPPRAPARQAERRRIPEQLSLPLDRAAGAREPPAAPETDASGPGLRVVAGGGAGAGHARGRLLVVGGTAAPIHLPDRAELERVLLGALADLLAGRITPTAAAAIRTAAVATIRAHDHVDADPDRLPELVRAARALRELVGSP